MQVIAAVAILQKTGPLEISQKFLKLEKLSLKRAKNILPVGQKKFSYQEFLS